MSSDLRNKSERLAEKLWYVVDQIRADGFSVREFLEEARWCWDESYRQAQERDNENFLDGLRKLRGH